MELLGKRLTEAYVCGNKHSLDPNLLLAVADRKEQGKEEAEAGVPFAAHPPLPE
jgi:hypothetical protein